MREDRLISPGERRTVEHGMESADGRRRRAFRALAGGVLALVSGLGMLPLLGQVAGAATSVSNVSGPSPSPVTAAVSSIYTIGFETSSAGALASGSGTITLTAPTGTAFPPTASAYTVNVCNSAGGPPCSSYAGAIDVSATPSLSNSNATVTITTPASVPNNTLVQVVVNGVTNPPAGTYKLGVSTSADSGVVYSTGYTILAAATSISSLSPISLSPNDYVSLSSVYAFSFEASASGALTTSNGIVIQGPAGTQFQATASDYTVNDVAASSIQTVSSGSCSGTSMTSPAAAVCVVLPVAVPDSGSVSVVAYGVVNPSSAGSYSIMVSTSSDTVAVPSANYVVVTQPTAVTLVDLKEPAPGGVVLAGSSGQTYEVSFNATNGLASNGTITLAGPSGTTFSAAATDYTVGAGSNGAVTVGSIVSGGGTAQVTLLNPAGAVNAGTGLTVTANAVTNTATPGTYSIDASDSTDAAPVPALPTDTTGSDSFTSSNEVTSAIGPTLSSSATDPNASTAAAVTYTYGFTTTSVGALAANSGTIVLAGPTGTVFPTSGSDYTVDNVAVSVTVSNVCPAAIPPAGYACAVLTTPVAVAGSAPVTVVASNVTNPSVTSNTSETGLVATSADEYPALTQSYAINSATAISGVTSADSAGAYTITFTTSGSGGLASGSGTISVDAPSGLDWSSSGAKVNGNPASVSGGGSADVNLTVPVTIGANSAVTVTLNASTDLGTGRYQLQVFTSTDTTPVESAWYDVGSPSATAVSSVSGPVITPNDYTTTSGNTYEVSFYTSSTGGLNGNSAAPTGAGTVGLTSSAATTALPTSASDYVVNGVPAVGLEGSATYGVTLYMPVTVGAGGKVTVYINGVTNPGSASTSYTFTAATSTDVTPSTGPVYTIVAIPTSVTSPTWTSSSDATSAAGVQYNIGFTTSSAGALSGSSTIALTAAPPASSPAGTSGGTFPSTASSYTITGITAASVSLSNGNSTATITTAAAQNIAADTPVAVVVTGVTNGPVAGAYDLDITTSADALDLKPFSASGTVSAPSITLYSGVGSPGTPALSNLAQSASGVQYKFSFTTSPTGALAGGDTITIVGPTSSLPATVSDYVVDGVADSATLTHTCPPGFSAPVGDSCVNLTLRGLQSVGASTNVDIVVNGATNPSTAGTYSDYFATLSDEAAQETPIYTIESQVTSVSGPSIPLADDGSGAMATYTIGFDATSSGALAAGTGTITIAAPAGTVFPSGASSYTVGVNGGGAQAASAVTLQNSAATAVVTVPAAVGGGNTVSVVASGVTNPGPGSTYVIAVNTSADLAPKDTPTYQVQGSVSNPSGPSPNPGAPSVASTYTVSFTTSAAGALAAGTGTITLSVSSSNTSFPPSASAYTVNGTPVTAAPSGGNTNGITLTTPVSISNATSVTVVITGVTNPSKGSYQMAVSTSSDTFIAYTANYPIGSSVSAVSGPSPTTNTPGTSANYTIGFTTSASGSLAANSGTITLTAPTLTVFPNSVGAYTVNGSAVANISGGGTSTVTITVPVAVSASAPVAVDITGVTNPPGGTYTLDVNTSSDLVPVASPVYTITGTTVSGVTGPSPSSQIALATGVTYTVGFMTSPTGPLTGTGATITLTATAGTAFSSASTDYTVDNDPVATGGINLSNGGDTVTIRVPAAASIGDSTQATVVAGNVTNPTDGTYTMSVYTSADTEVASTPSYTIGSAVSAVSGPAPSNTQGGAKGVTYKVGFNTSAVGALASGTGTITLTAAAGTVFSPANTDYTVNTTAVGSTGIALSNAGATVTITVPVSIAKSSPVSIVANNVTNPAGGSYQMGVYTSADTMPASTSPYTIVNGAPTVTGIVPSSGPTAGGTQVTITGTNFASSATVDFGTAAGTSVAFVSSTEMTAVSPPGSAGPVNVVVTTSAGSSPTSSADQFTYIAPTGVTGVTGPSPSPATAGATNATYTIGFTTSATGELTSGASTITLTAPAGTILPSVSGDYGINGQPVTTAPAVSGTTVTITVPGGVAGSGAVKVVVDNVTNPLAGPYTMGVYTSSDTAPVATPSYTITAATPTGTGYVYTPLNPFRVVDTRCGGASPPSYCAGESLPSANSQVTSLSAGSTEKVTIDGTGASPDAVPLTGVAAVVVNITVDDFGGNSGYLTLYATGSTPPPVSAINWAKTSKGAIANLGTIPVSAGGTITVANGAGAGTVDYELDVQGYYSAPGSGSTAGLFNSVKPYRLADTRCANNPSLSDCSGLPSANKTLGTVAADAFDKVAVSNAADGVPSSGVSAVVLNVTVADTSAGAGYFTVYPDGSPRATVSNLNWSKGESAVPNRVTVDVPSSGYIDVYSSAAADAIVDISGYYTDGSSKNQTGSLFNPITPTRYADTRCSTNSALGDCAGISALSASNGALQAIPALTEDAVTIAGIGTNLVPSGAVGFVGNLTVAAPTKGGFLAVNPVGLPPSTSDVNFVAGSTVANMVIGGLNSQGGVEVYNSGATATNMILDVSGYFGPAV